MGIVSRGFVDQSQITSGLQRATKVLKPDVVRIRYSIGEDWSGDPSIFFRIVLSDEASKETRLREMAQRARMTILSETKADDLGLNPYFNFRSLSEQTKLNDEMWA